MAAFTVRCAIVISPVDAFLALAEVPPFGLQPIPTGRNRHGCLSIMSIMETDAPRAMA